MVDYRYVHCQYRDPGYALCDRFNHNEGIKVSTVPEYITCPECRNALGWSPIKSTIEEKPEKERMVDFFFRGGS